MSIPKLTQRIFPLEENVALLAERTKASRYNFTLPANLTPSGLDLSNGKLSVIFEGPRHTSIRSLNHVLTVTTPTLPVKLEKNESLDQIALLEGFQLSEIIKDEPRADQSNAA